MSPALTNADCILYSIPIFTFIYFLFHRTLISTHYLKKKLFVTPTALYSKHTQIPPRAKATFGGSEYVGRWAVTCLATGNLSHDLWTTAGTLSTKVMVIIYCLIYLLYYYIMYTNKWYKSSAFRMSSQNIEFELCVY